jgi:hypothetical protein
LDVLYENCKKIYFPNWNFMCNYYQVIVCVIFF